MQLKPAKSAARAAVFGGILVLGLGSAQAAMAQPENYVACNPNALVSAVAGASSGGTLYLTMPFGTHVNHGWFQIFDAPMVDSLIETFRPSRQRETIYRYLPEGWTVGDRASAKDATYFDIHKQKDYDADYAAASRAVVCLELTK